VTAGAVLNADQLRFIRLVVSRRFGGERPADVDASAPAGDTAFQRAAGIAASLLRDPGPGRVKRPAAFVAMCCQLDSDGYDLLAPQGAAAGMIGGLDAGRVDQGALVRWLEDRAVSRNDPPG